MADKKVSELDAITGADTAADDLFLIVDTSGTVTKKITRAELNNAIEQDVLAQVDITSANIDGGTIDNTPIGAATASTGSFTDLTVTGTVTGITQATGNELENVVEDTTPQLGGNLDLNSNDITGTGNIDNTGTITTDGLTVAGNVSVDGGTIKLDGNYPTGTNNVALGDAALDSITTGSQNVAIGPQALTNNTTANSNVGIGLSALRDNTTGSDNIAVGAVVLSVNTTGSNNTAVGKSSLAANTTANHNTALGYNTLAANTTGAQNVALGSVALDANTTASNNTAMGYAALGANTTGASNVAVGANALDANTDGDQNVAIGQGALGSNTTANNNTAVGYATLNANTTGYSNVALGQYAGNSLTTGAGNCFVGQNTASGASGSLMTTGSKNTILGGYNGNQDGLDIRTASNHIVLSDGDGNPRFIMSGENAILGTTSVVGAGSPRLSMAFDGSATWLVNSDDTSGTSGARHQTFHSNGTEVGRITTTTSATSFTSVSDHRLKENVADMTGATERLKQLNPVRFNFIADADTTVDGFIAHEVQTVVPEAITGTHNEVDGDGNPVYQGIDQSKLVPLLVATIQELEARIAALESN